MMTPPNEPWMARLHDARAERERVASEAHRLLMVSLSLAGRLGTMGAGVASLFATMELEGLKAWGPFGGAFAQGILGDTPDSLWFKWLRETVKAYLDVLERLGSRDASRGKLDELVEKNGRALEALERMGASLASAPAPRTREGLPVVRLCQMSDGETTSRSLLTADRIVRAGVKRVTKTRATIVWERAVGDTVTLVVSREPRCGDVRYPEFEPVWSDLDAAEAELIVRKAKKE